MWAWLAGRVLRNRLAILIAIGLMTAGLGYMASRVAMNYKHGGLLPENDSAYVDYERFLSTFREDGNVLVVGTQSGPTGDLYTPANFKAWSDLGDDLKDIDGIDSVFSEAHLFTLLRDDSLQRFVVRPLMSALPNDQLQMDSLRARIRALPFYHGLMYNDSTKASLMMVFVNAKLFDTDARRQAASVIGLIAIKDAARHVAGAVDHRRNRRGRRRGRASNSGRTAVVVAST